MMGKAMACGLAIAAFCTATAAPARAQEPALETPGVLRVQSRLVVEDVLVMDKDGNPVHGLPASAFHLSDNGAPQRIGSFEEGSGSVQESATSGPSLPPGTFSTATQAGPAPTTEVLLVDTDGMALTDQMFLLAQLKKAVAAMPANLPASLFTVRAGRAVPLLLNTTDREALLRVAGDALPIQSHAVDSRFQSAVNQLMSAAAYLQQTPGRKNLLWFAGQFPLVSTGQGSAAGAADFGQREHTIHLVQEALAEARISVYPIDVRGVLANVMAPADAGVGGPSAGAVGGRNPSAVNAASQRRGTAAPDVMSESADRSEMRVLAATTGGRAYFLNNLAQEIDQAFELGRSAYTLSYSPSPYATDESWHKVSVMVDGGYTLSYRTGYLATWAGVAETESRYKLVAGSRQKVDPEQRKPLVFEAQVLPDADGQHVTVHYSVPIDQLSTQPLHGVYSNTLTVTSFAYDAGGRVKGGKVQELNTTLTTEQYAQARDAKKKIATRQEIPIPKSAKYLLLIVRDKTSQRTGSLLLQTSILASLPPAPPATPLPATPPPPGR